MVHAACLSSPHAKHACIHATAHISSPPSHTPQTGKDGRNQVEAKKQAIFEEERGRLAAVEAAKIRQNEVQRALRAAQFKKDAEIRLQKAGEEL